jgi:hypothetical protein
MDPDSLVRCLGLERRLPKARFVARFEVADLYTPRCDVIEAQVAATDLDAHQRNLMADSLVLPDLRDTDRGMVASGGLCRLRCAPCKAPVLLLNCFTEGTSPLCVSVAGRGGGLSKRPHSFRHKNKRRLTARVAP